MKSLKWFKMLFFVTSHNLYCFEGSTREKKCFVWTRNGVCQRNRNQAQHFDKWHRTCWIPVSLLVKLIWTMFVANEQQKNNRSTSARQTHRKWWANKYCCEWIKMETEPRWHDMNFNLDILGFSLSVWLVDTLPKSFDPRLFFVWHAPTGLL